MHSTVVSDVGRKRLFDGEVIRNFKRTGELYSVSIKPFRHEGTGCAIFEVSRTLPDIHGVYNAKAIVEGLKAARSSCFFPREWTPGEVLQAVEEAYAVRVPIKKRGGNFCIGVSSASVEIVMELDVDGLVIDAFPRRGKQMKKRAVLLWKMQHGKVEARHYICGRCGVLKERQWICPRGHNIPKKRGKLHRRLRYHVRRWVFGLGRVIKGEPFDIGRKAAGAGSHHQK
jgi:hypothetical protein